MYLYSIIIQYISPCITASPSITRSEHSFTVFHSSFVRVQETALLVLVFRSERLAVVETVIRTHLAQFGKLQHTALRRHARHAPPRMYRGASWVYHKHNGRCTHMPVTWGLPPNMEQDTPRNPGLSESGCGQGSLRGSHHDATALPSGNVSVTHTFRWDSAHARRRYRQNSTLLHQCTASQRRHTDKSVLYHTSVRKLHPPG